MGFSAVWRVPNGAGIQTLTIRKSWRFLVVLVRVGVPRLQYGSDQPIAALLKDLKQRGLLEETLVIWSGEFGRTPMKENRGGVDGAFVGRDHNPGAFTLWMAGGGAKPGFTYGETDPIGYEAVKDKVSVHDFHATVLKMMGFDHEKFSFPFQGANQRLTNITKPGTKVIKDLIA